MTLPLTFAWCFIALIAGLFIASVYYDARHRKLKEKIERLRLELYQAEFAEIVRQNSRAEFEKECG